MSRQPIPIHQLKAQSHHLWAEQWLLLTSGDFSAARFNTMTVAWGSLGTMWNKPFAQVVVRPVRFTYQFMEQYDTFTLSVLGAQYRPALQLLGTRSGRDGDKIVEAGLTPIASAQVAAPAFAEAELVIECRKIYYTDFDPRHFLAPEIHELYPQKDYHRAYFGEILAVSGDDSYRSP